MLTKYSPSLRQTWSLSAGLGASRAPALESCFNYKMFSARTLFHFKVQKLESGKGNRKDTNLEAGPFKEMSKAL